jgi:large subunit ribosomal protein L18
MATSQRTLGRLRRKKKVRKTLSGSALRPRLCVYRSNKHIYAQIIDDDTGRTLASSSSLTVACRAEIEKDETKKTTAKKIGLHLAQQAQAAGVSKVSFDRNGFKYHGRLASLADGAREGGLIL